MYSCAAEDEPFYLVSVSLTNNAKGELSEGHQIQKKTDDIDLCGLYFMIITDVTIIVSIRLRFLTNIYLISYPKPSKLI